MTAYVNHALKELQTGNAQIVGKYIRGGVKMKLTKN